MSNISKDLEPATRIQLVSRALSGKESVEGRVAIGAKEFSVTLAPGPDGTIHLDMVDGDWRVGSKQEVYRFRFDSRGRLLKASGEVGTVRPSQTDAAGGRGWMVPSQSFSPRISFADQALRKMTDA